jgi:predicted phage terminase large subunit-like protein
MGLIPKGNSLLARRKQSLALSPDDARLKFQCETDFALFVKEFFPNDLRGKPSQMHQDLFDLFSGEFKKGMSLSLAAPRGNAKTTVAVMIRVIHAIVYCHVKMILIIGYSEAEAKDKLADIKRHLETNDRLRAVYGNLTGPVNAIKEIITANDVRVVVRGRGGQVRGLKHGQDRPGLIILDDIESIESTNTPEQRLKTKNWVEKDVLGTEQTDKSTQVILCGTVINFESYLTHTLSPDGYDVKKKYAAVKSFATRQDLWANWAELYRDLDDPDAKQTAKQYYLENKQDMDHGCETLWPDGETYYDLMVYRLKKGVASFQSEKQNHPLDPSTQIFRPDDCVKFNIKWGEADILNEPKFWIIRHDKEISSNDLKIIAAHDPVMAKSDDSDYAAIVVVAQDNAGYCYLLDAYLKRVDPSKQVDASLGLCQKWGVEKIIFEEQGFQALIKPWYEDRKRLYGMETLRYHGITQHKNKQWRISSMEPWFSNGWILFNSTIDNLMLDQLRMFPTAHDDGPDALQMCIGQLKQPRSEVMQTTSGTLLR